MSKKQSLLVFLLMVATVSALMAFTSQKLVTKTRFGLEFRGGYEIYYVVSPASGKSTVTSDDLLATARILGERADGIGMAEPEIHIEGANHIRLKMAGLTSSNESRSSLGESRGLPTILTEKYTQTVGSVLGNTALKETLTAGAIGIGCIFLLLILLYRGMGVVASFCTLIYLWGLLVVFNTFHATLSLSAVVAFVLGIGMAADASIICFERVREELLRGSTMSKAVRSGFDGSFPTIRDANLVTALAMFALFIAGIGPIQGFSLTMLVSIVISIITNYYLVRTLCILLADADIIPSGVLISRRFAVENNNKHGINFVGMGRKAFLVSFLIVMAGTLYYRAHGFNLDIDFTAGTALDIDLTRAIDQSTATKIMTDAGIVPATVSIGGKNNEHIAARFDEILQPKQLQQIISAFKSKYDSHVEYEENTADPGVARDFAMRAIYAVVAACVSIFLYIGIRFSWSIALATLFAIVHDLLIVSAIFALFKFEVDVTFIAALLTIMGYSLNDKIVIFGRIRENSKASENMSVGVSEPSPLRNLVNMSIRQTLGRSIYTVITVVLASAALLTFACEPLQMFALAILVGLISGAYSSILLAPMCWIALSRRNITRSGEEGTDVASKSSRWYFPVTIGVLSLSAVVLWFVIPTLHHESMVQATPSVMSSATTGSLGDLSPYIAIAQDSLQLVQSGNWEQAKKRITDLETAWDVAEEKLEPMSPENWTSIDKSIDRALAALRSGQPDVTTSVEAVQALIAKCQNITSKRP